MYVFNKHRPLSKMLKQYEMSNTYTTNLVKPALSSRVHTVVQCASSHPYSYLVLLHIPKGVHFNLDSH